MIIAVLGSQGLLGREFIKLSNEVIPYSHRDCDITSYTSLMTMFQCKPNVVINCAGIVRSRIEEYSKSKVIDINSKAPHVLDVECLFRNVKLIQISTDCVFDGKSQASYKETDQPTPEDFYAVTKLAGEVDCFKHTTIRTSFVGPDGGLLGWAKKQRVITGYDLEWWNGLTAREVAKWVLDYAHTDMQYRLVHVYGDVYSKYEILKSAKQVFGYTYELRQGPTPPDRKRSRVLTSSINPKIDIPLDKMLRAYCD